MSNPKDLTALITFFLRPIIMVAGCFIAYMIYRCGQYKSYGHPY